MKEKLPAILFLLCMPLSVAVFIFVDSKVHSEPFALLASVFFYVLAAVLIGVWQNKKHK